MAEDVRGGILGTYWMGFCGCFAVVHAGKIFRVSGTRRTRRVTGDSRGGVETGP